MGRSSTANDLIHCIRDWTSRMGWPIRIRSDGGPQMDSISYKGFCDDNFIRPSFSSPLMHCSTAEVAVKAAKNILRKTRHKSPEFYAALLEYRSSPRSHSHESPNSLVFKTLPRTLIPAILENQLDTAAQHVNERRREHLSRADNYTPHKHDMTTLSDGQSVLVYNNVTKVWDRQGKILKRNRQRSYQVEMADNSRLWRNRKLLQPIPSENGSDICENPAESKTLTAADTSSASKPRRSTRVRRRPQRFC